MKRITIPLILIVIIVSLAGCYPDEIYQIYPVDFKLPIGIQLSKVVAYAPASDGDAIIIQIKDSGRWIFTVNPVKYPRGIHLTARDYARLIDKVLSMKINVSKKSFEQKKRMEKKIL